LQFLAFKQISSVLNGLITTPEGQKNFKRRDLAKFIKEVVAPEKVFANQAKEVQEKIKDFYLNRGAPENPDYKFWIQRYTDVRMRKKWFC
jgi:hypothetical protein